MQIFRTPEEIQVWRHKLHASQSIGFVATMGALHEGHEQLLRKSRIENSLSVLSIFINPTQFNDKNDFINYPNTIERDIEIARQMDVDAIFAPAFETMYPDNYRYKVTESEFSHKLCGQHRPGHFDGVLTVVLKLFNLIRPHKAYFGEKDFQQLSLIKDMVQALFLNLLIVPVPTVRESSGLAKSSRNARLDDSEKTTAAEINKSIRTLRTTKEVYQRLSDLGLKVEYVEDIDGRRFVAAKLNDVRLIDNVEL